MVGRATFTADDRNGVIKPVAVDITSTMYLFTAVPEASFMPIALPSKVKGYPLLMGKGID
jgi:hypothetical protein